MNTYKCLYCSKTRKAKKLPKGWLADIVTVNYKHEKIYICNRCKK